MQEYYAGNGNINQGGVITPMSRERLIEYFENVVGLKDAELDALKDKLAVYEPLIRPVYTCKITQARMHSNAFLVMRMRVPIFPGDLPILPVVAQPLTAIIAANDDEGAWGFVALTSEEKFCIGGVLEDMGAEWDTWYYCELYEHRPVKGRESAAEALRDQAVFADNTTDIVARAVLALDVEEPSSEAFGDQLDYAADAIYNATIGPILEAIDDVEKRSAIRKALYYKLANELQD